MRVSQKKVQGDRGVEEKFILIQNDEGLIIMSKGQLMRGFFMKK